VIARLISASLDNTIRTWDPKDMSCLSTLENNDPSEIAAIHYLKNANLLVTGHDNGDVKLWNADLGSYLVVDQTNPAMRHLNMVCCLASHTFNTGQGGETNEFLFSAGYDGKVNVWEIFEKRAFGNSITSSNIVPQLKHSIVANRNAVANVHPTPSCRASAMRYCACSSMPTRTVSSQQATSGRCT
jgi:WD40 repeat protein